MGPVFAANNQNSSNTFNDISGVNDEDTLLNPRDIYLRVAQNLELIELYIVVNNKIIEEQPKRVSALLVRTTRCLLSLKEVLQLIEIKPTFQH